MKKLTWEYNGKYYLKIDAVKIKELLVEAVFKKRCTIHYGFNLFEIRLSKEWRTNYWF